MLHGVLGLRTPVHEIKSVGHYVQGLGAWPMASVPMLPFSCPCADAALMGLGVVGVKPEEEDKKSQLADVLSDFDLRPSWALAVALKEAVRDEMRRAWHSDEAAEECGPLNLSDAGASDSKDTEKAANVRAEEETGARCQRKFVPEQQDMVRQ